MVCEYYINFIKKICLKKRALYAAPSLVRHCKIISKIYCKKGNKKCLAYNARFMLGRYLHP